jgi:hypothetical protein
MHAQRRRVRAGAPNSALGLLRAADGIGFGLLTLATYRPQDDPMVAGI